MFDIAEFLFDAVGDLVGEVRESGADVAAESEVDVALDPGVALAAPTDIAGGGASSEFDNHPISATLRSA